MFGNNASSPQFQESIELTELQHYQVLNAHYQTYGTQHEAPYVVKQEFLSLQNVVEGDDGTITTYIDTVRMDNGYKNIVDGTGTGTHRRANYVIRKVDGVVKIVEPPSCVDQYDRPHRSLPNTCCGWYAGARGRSTQERPHQRLVSHRRVGHALRLHIWMTLSAASASTTTRSCSRSAA